MPRLLRSPYSDPISAGITAFGQISDILDRREALQMKRELMEREKVESTLRMQAQQEEMAWNRKTRERMGMQWAREDDLRNFNSAIAKLNTGQELDDSDYDAILKATHNAPNWQGLSPDQWGDLHSNLRTLKNGIDKIWPQIAQAWQKGEGVYISRSQAPDLFSVWDKIPSYGGDVSRGNDRFGTSEGVEKSLERIYFDPRTGTMTPYLRVKDSKGNTYEAPMTYDRGNDPNAPVVQLPVQLFNAHLNAQLRMADWADTVRMKLGDKEVLRRYETQREMLRQNQIWLAGEDAVDDLLKSNPNANVNDLRNTFKKAVREKSKELGIAISEKDITSEADKISERTQKTPTETDILTLPETDPRRKRYIEGKRLLQKPEKLSEAEILTLPEIDPRRQRYLAGKESIEGAKREMKSLTETEILTLPDSDQRKKDYISGKKALEKAQSLTEAQILSLPDTDPRKKAYIAGKRVLKEVETKPLSVTDQRQLRDEAFGRFSKLLPAATYEEKDLKDDIIKRKNLDELISNLPDEIQSRARDMVDCVTEIKQNNPKLTWNQAFNQAEKELGKIEKPLKKIDQYEIDSIVERINELDDPNKKTKEEAERIAREEGYDPGNVFEGYGYGGGIFGLWKSFGSGRAPIRAPSRQLRPRSEILGDIERKRITAPKPDISEVEKEMRGRPKGKYKVEGHKGYWDGKKFKWSSEETTPLKPITQKVIDEIKNEINRMKVKPRTPEEARELARKKARERGYDPTTRAEE